MHLLSTLVFSITANTDNFVVGLSYGIKKIQIRILSNLLISIISCIGTAISMLIGKVIFYFIPEFTANIVGSLILVFIGLWTIFKALSDRKNTCAESSNRVIYYDNVLDHPEKLDFDHSGYIDEKESVFLALALTINNLGLGIGASITGLNIALTSAFTLIMSILSLSLGHFIGMRYLSKALGKYAGLVSGLLMVIIGIYEMFV